MLRFHSRTVARRRFQAQIVLKLPLREALMASSTTLARGYLLKHNRDHRKSNLLGAKYHKRWVEVTADTMVYAASQQEVLTGHIQVFSIADMLWVKTEGDNKFQVKFTERSLKLKVASGGKEERDQWVGALQTAKKQHAAAAEARRSGAGKLEQLQKALLQPAAGLGGTSTAGGSLASESGSSMVLSSTGTSLDGTSQAGGRSSSTAGNRNNNTSTSFIPALHLTASSFGATEPSLSGQQPPSPRTLLASARAGMALVSTGSPAGTPRTRAAPGVMAAAQPLKPPAAQERFFFSRPEPSDSGDDDGGTGGTGTDTEGSSAADDAEDQQPSLGASAHDQALGGQVKGGAAAAAPLQVPSAGLHSPRAIGAEGSGQSTPSSAHRAGLARCITPGVLLTSSRPTTPAASTSSQQLGLTLSPGSPHVDSATASRLSFTAAAPAPTAAAAAFSATVPARPVSPVPLALPGADEVLLLEEPTADHGVPNKPHVLGTATPSASNSTQSLDIYSSRLYATTTKSTTNNSLSTSSSSNRHQPSHTPLAAMNSSADSSGDEVLRLDDDEEEEEGLPAPSSPLTYSTPRQQQPQPPQQCATGAAVSRPGMLQVESRPGSAASTYRPGTPLKSCLHNSPNSAAAAACT